MKILAFEHLDNALDHQPADYSGAKPNPATVAT